MPARAPLSSVLCPVDFSSHSRAALRYGARLASRPGGSLTVFYVNDPFLITAAASAYDEQAIVSQSDAELSRFVRQTLGATASGSRRTVTGMGDPVREILTLARKIPAGAIVVGSEGLSGVRRIFFGSTTARLLAHAQVPVLAVPGSDPARVKPGWPGPRVLVAIDLGRGTAPDVKAAVEIARWFGVDLTFVHIVERTRRPGWLALRGGPHDRDRVTHAHRRLEALARQAGIGRPDVHVLVGDPAALLAALATDVGAGLVMLTLKGADRLFGDRKGETTYRVVCEAGTPVLALPSGWRPPASRAPRER
jgi:nucleotide-binding universal stress UspA family protein